MKQKIRATEIDYAGFQQQQSTAPVDKNTLKIIFAGIKPIITEEVVMQMNVSFLFELSGKNAGCWYSR